MGMSPASFAADPGLSPDVEPLVLGRLRSLALDHLLLGSSGRVPAALRDPLLAWAQERAYLSREPALGCDPEGMPSEWFRILALAGLPFARGGGLHWGRDLFPASDEEPALVDGRLRLPALPVARGLTSLPWRPLREWMALHLGVRLKLGTGVRLWLWRHHALLISCSPLPQGGFMVGPLQGMRHALVVEPGGEQQLSWDPR